MISVSETLQLIYDEVKYVIKVAQAGGENEATIPMGTHGVFFVTSVDADGKPKGQHVQAKVRTFKQRSRGHLKDKVSGGSVWGATS